MTIRLPGSETTLKLKRTFAAPREKVFQAWTRPELLSRWLGGAQTSALRAEIDLQVGGRYRLEINSPSGDPVFVIGTYQEITAPEKLIFTWAFESQADEQPETLVTVAFVQRGDETEVILQHERFENAAARDLHTEGWLLCFDRLLDLL